MMYKEIQRANEARFKRSQRGKVICGAYDPHPMRVHKPGRHLSKAEKKRAKIWSRSMAILNAAAEGKTELRQKALRVSKDGATLTIEAGLEE